VGRILVASGAPHIRRGDDSASSAGTTRASVSTVFESLDFLYVPTDDVDASVRDYVERLGAELVWKVRGMGTVVARLRVSESGPAVLLSGHLEGEQPILIYRVGDYAAAVARLRAAGVQDLHEVEIPHGPCATFRAGGHRLAVYELTRPAVDEHFAGRVDEP
jgi:catechol 2,3-dioxygenase-like lactoylglutathione lyase family enzyme